MGRYSIIQVDPTPYKYNILKFWEEYLPGTSSERFDWLNHGNPAGPAIWFLALDQKKAELSGIITIMPRDFYLRGEIIKAGIMGDFMVSSSDRVFGPGLLLPKAVMSRVSELGFDIIYTIPNDESRKIVERSGFIDHAVLKHLVKPIATKHYLKNYFTNSICDIIAPVGDSLLSILSRISSLGTFEDIGEENSIDPSFDILWEKIKMKERGLIGDYSRKYLEWRFLKNPQLDFKIIKCRDNYKILQGFAIYSSGSGKMGINCILALENRYYKKIFNSLFFRARDIGCHAIYLRTTDNSLISPHLRGCLFFNAKDDAKIFLHEERKLVLNNWVFFSGDRNI